MRTQERIRLREATDDLGKICNAQSGGPLPSPVLNVTGTGSKAAAVTCLVLGRLPSQQISAGPRGTWTQPFALTKKEKVENAKPISQCALPATPGSQCGILETP